MTFAAFFEKIGGKIGVVCSDGGRNDGVSWLVSLDKHLGFFAVAATDATDDLGQEMESVFFGGEIGKGETGIGLDDADGGESWEIQTFGDGLGADDNIVIAVFYFCVERI